MFEVRMWVGVIGGGPPRRGRKSHAELDKEHECSDVQPVFKDSEVVCPICDEKINDDGDRS